SLEFADDLAGFETACYACYNPLKVPRAPVNAVRPPEPPPPAPQPDSQWRKESPADPWKPEYPPGLADEVSYSSRTSRSYGSSSGFSAAFKVRLLCGLVIVAIGVIGLYMSGGDVWIYFDNGV